MGSQTGHDRSGDDCDLLDAVLSMDHGSDLHRQRVHRARHVRRLDLRANAELPVRALPDRGAGDGVRIHLSSGGDLGRLGSAGADLSGRAVELRLRHADYDQHDTLPGPSRDLRAARAGNQGQDADGRSRGHVMLGARVANRQLASTTPAADKAGEQSVAVLWRSVMSACGQVVAHHLADRLRPLPADVTLMDAWDQRQPFGSRLTTAPGLDHACGCIISCRDTTLTIGVGAAVDRVLDHPVDGRIVRPAPDYVTIMALGGQVQPMLNEPEQGLPDTAVVEDEDDGLLDTAIG